MVPDGKPPTKPMSIRFPAVTARALEAVARIDGRSQNQLVVDAVDHLIDERRKDTAFRARVREIMKEDREVLERLAR